MIDWDRVASLRNEIGADDFAEVVAMFLEEADEVTNRLRAGVSAAGLEAELHFLKGAALNLGLRHLADLCQTGERRAGQGAPVDVMQVIRAYEAAKAAFRAGPARKTGAA